MADGKVTIEASLDTDEFEKELETLRKTATKALEEIEKAAGELSDALSKLTDSGKSFDSLGDSAAEAGTQLETLSDSTDEAEGKVEGLGDQAKSTGKQVDNLGGHAEESEDKIGDLGDAAKSTEDQVDVLGEQAQNTQEEISGLGDQAEEAGDGLGELGEQSEQAEEGLDGLGDRSKDTSDDVDGLGEKAKQTEEDLDGLGNQSQQTKNDVDGLGEETEDTKDQFEGLSEGSETLRNKIGVLTAQYEAAQKEVEELTEEFNKSVDATGATSQESQDLAKQLESAEKKAANFQKKLSKMTDELDDAGDAADSASEDVDTLGDETEDAGEQVQDADDKFSTWQITLGNLAAQAITNLIDKIKDLATSVSDLGINFTSAMSEVQAISGATDSELEELTATAREYGATTTFSATEAAEALKYMSLAGWDVEESTSALGGVLDLAAASGMDLAEASDMVTDYLSAFGMEASDSAYLADMLAYAQSNANTSTEQLGEAYKNCAANLNAAGQDVETVTALLEGMANQGTKGSEAGTALAAIMRDITNSMEDGAIKIGDTSVAVSDADGNFRDLTDILSDVEKATDGMGDAQKSAAIQETFTAEATNGLNLLLNEGIDNIAGYEEELRSAGGTAAETADTMNDNLGGDLKAMNSAFEELGLKVFDGMEEPLRSVVQFVTDSVIPALTSLIDGSGDVGDVLGSVFTPALDAVTGFANNFASAVPDIIDTVLGMAGQLVSAIAECGPQMADAAVNIIHSLTTYLAENFPSMVSSGLETLLSFSQGLRENVGYIVDAALELITTLAQGLIANIPTLIETVPEIVTNIAGCINDNAPKLLETAVTLIGQLALGLIQAIPTLVANIPQILTAIVAVFEAFNWISLGKNIMTLFTKGITSMVSSLKSAGTDVLNSIYNAIKSLPTKLSSLGKSGISGLASGIRGMLSSAKSAASSILTGCVNAITSLPSKLLSIGKSAITKMKSVFKQSEWVAIGKNVINGIISGITSMVGSLYSSIKSALSGLVDKAKDALGIHSPSTVFKTQVGKQVVAGIAEGIDTYTDKATTSMTKLANKLLKTAKSANKTGEYEEIAKDIVDSYSDGIDSYVSKAESSVENLVNKQISTLKKKNKKLKSQLSSLGEDLVSAYNTAIEKAAEEAKTELEDTLTELSETMQEKYDELIQMQENLQSKLSSYGSLYDEDENGNITVSTKTLDDEIAALKQYNSNIAYLEGKISDDLLNEIGEMDVDEALAYTTALMEMSDSELAAYNKKYEQRQSLAAKTAKNFYANQISELQKNYIDEIEDAFTAAKKKIQSAGKDAISGFISGMEKAAKSGSSSYKKIANSLVSALKKELGIKSPSTVFRDEVGVYVPAGIAKGVEKNAGVAEDAVADVADGMVAAFGDESGYAEAGGAAIAAYSEALENAEADAHTLKLDADTTAIEEKLAGLSAAVELHLPDITPYLDQMEAAVELRIAEITARVDARANTGSGVVSALDSEKIDYTALAKAVIQGFIEAGITVNVNERVFGRLVAEYS